MISGYQLSYGVNGPWFQNALFHSRDDQLTWARNPNNDKTSDCGGNHLTSAICGNRGDAPYSTGGRRASRLIAVFTEIREGDGAVRP